MFLFLFLPFHFFIGSFIEFKLLLFRVLFHDFLLCFYILEFIMMTFLTNKFFGDFSKMIETNTNKMRHTFTRGARFHLIFFALLLAYLAFVIKFFDFFCFFHLNILFLSLLGSYLFWFLNLLRTFKLNYWRLLFGNNNYNKET